MKKIARCEDFRGVGKVLLNCKWIALLYTNIPVTKEDESCNKITLVVWPSAEGPRDRKVTNRPLASWISKWNFFRSRDEGIVLHTLSFFYKNTFFSSEPWVFLESLEFQPQNILRIFLLDTSFQLICLILKRFCVKINKWASAIFLPYSYFQANLSLGILINFILIKKTQCNEYIVLSRDFFNFSNKGKEF